MSNTQEWSNWTYEKRCRKAVEALQKNEFTAVYCANREEAISYILNEAKSASSVGLGGSLTLQELGIVPLLQEMSKEIIQNSKTLTEEERRQVGRRMFCSDLFLSSSNALTLNGFLVNIDGTGNRVASLIFGPAKVIVVLGRNKIVENTELALKRIKEFAVPANSRKNGTKNPCAGTGFCIDCQTPSRSCRITVILERKPRLQDFHVLVVNETLGL
ncbi:MAG TPA: lactate utilization protein [Syntrophomonas sp.]|nr:lactate utilization protein [Syntrophomonas sp.]